MTMVLYLFLIHLWDVLDLPTLQELDYWPMTWTLSAPNNLREAVEPTPNTRSFYRP